MRLLSIFRKREAEPMAALTYKSLRERARKQYGADHPWVLRYFPERQPTLEDLTARMFDLEGECAKQREHLNSAIVNEATERGLLTAALVRIEARLAKKSVADFKRARRGKR